MNHDINETKGDLAYGIDMEKQGYKQCDTCSRWTLESSMTDGECAGCRCHKCSGALVKLAGDFERCTLCGAVHHSSAKRYGRRFIATHADILLIAELLKGLPNAAE